KFVHVNELRGRGGVDRKVSYTSKAPETVALQPPYQDNYYESLQTLCFLLLLLDLFEHFLPCLLPPLLLVFDPRRFVVRKEGRLQLAHSDRSEYFRLRCYLSSTLAFNGHGNGAIPFFNII